MCDCLKTNENVFSCLKDEEISPEEYDGAGSGSSEKEWPESETQQGQE